jgi:hypothetical protein
MAFVQAPLFPIIEEIRWVDVLGFNFCDEAYLNEEMRSPNAAASYLW